MPDCLNFLGFLRVWAASLNSNLIQVTPPAPLTQPRRCRGLSGHSLGGNPGVIPTLEGKSRGYSHLGAGIKELFPSWSRNPGVIPIWVWKLWSYFHPGDENHGIIPILGEGNHGIIPIHANPRLQTSWPRGQGKEILLQAPGKAHGASQSRSGATPGWKAALGGGVRMWGHPGLIPSSPRAASAPSSVPPVPTWSTGMSPTEAGEAGAASPPARRIPTLPFPLSFYPPLMRLIGNKLCRAHPSLPAPTPAGPRAGVGAN